MPVSLYSSTGALEFRPSRLLSRPFLVDADYRAPSSLPDEIIDPPPCRAREAVGMRAILLAALVFGILQAAALAPPLYLAGVLAS